MILHLHYNFDTKQAKNTQYPQSINQLHSTKHRLHFYEWDSIVYYQFSTC